jgi:GntR family transcriptional regulator/MocR family aminotransferase
MSHLRAGFLPSIGLDPAASTPLRRQLYEWFRRAIADGRLKSGQRVPSSRSLAEELKVSRLTVVSAYEQLEAARVLASRRRFRSYCGEAQREQAGPKEGRAVRGGLRAARSSSLACPRNLSPRSPGPFG